MEDPRIISTQFNSPKMPYYNVLVNKISTGFCTLKQILILFLLNGTATQLISFLERLIFPSACNTDIMCHCSSVSGTVLRKVGGLSMIT